MRVPFLLALAAISYAAEPWSLERLFTRPWVWGSRPANMTWSKQGHTVVFLWDAEGSRFQDVYSYNPDTKKRIRLSQMESISDPLTRSAAERDEHQKNFVEPEPGVTS